MILLAAAFGAGVSLGGVLWRVAALEYRRRWREAVQIMQRMDDDRTYLKRRTLSAADLDRVTAIAAKYK